jgi:hypothetical protein
VFDTSSIFAPFGEALLGVQTEFALSFVLIGFLILMDGFDARLTLERLLVRIPLVVRWGAYYLLGAAVLFSGLYGSGAGQFIYFQF